MNTRRSFVLGSVSLLSTVAKSNSDPGPVRLTIDSSQNAAFAAGLRAAMRPVGKALAGKLLQPLADARIDPGNPHRALVHALVVVNGEIRGAYSDYPPALVTAASQGSISKALGLVLLEKHRPELTGVESRWVARPLGGLREADGTRGGGVITAYEAVARSRNLPSAWAFMQAAPDGVLRRELGGAGLDLPKGYRAAVSLAFGHVAWAPVDLVQFFHGLAGGPTVRFAADTQPRTSLMAKWIASRGNELGAVRALLAGPVMHGRGTLHHLRADLVGRSPIAKTGTATNARGQDIAKVAVQSFRTTQGWATTYLGVFAPSPDYPLGDRIPTAAFAPMHRHLINFSKEITK